MSRAEQVEIVERITEAWNTHDPDAVAACYAADAVSRDVTITEALHGRAAIRNAAAMYMHAFPDIQFEIRRVVCDRDVVCEEWRATATHRGDLMGLAATGRRAETAGCNVMRLGDDARIHAETTYWDAAALYRQLGALPELAHAAAGG
jgi:C-1 hydroxylase